MGNDQHWTPPAKALIFLKYIYLVVVVATITRMLCCCHLTVMRKRELCSPFLLIVGIQKKEETTLVYVIRRIKNIKLWLRICILIWLDRRLALNKSTFHLDINYCRWLLSAKSRCRATDRVVSVPIIVCFWIGGSVSTILPQSYNLIILGHYIVIN